MTGLSYYRIRLGEREIQCDLEGLLVLAEANRIESSTRIIPPFSESWQAAGGLIELAGRLTPAPSKDPWSAWEEMDGDIDDELWEDLSDTENTEEEDWEDGPTNVSAIHPAPPLEEPPTEPAPLPATSLTPLEPERPAPTEEQAPLAPKPVPDRGQVIAFPGSRVRAPATAGAYALADDHPIHRLPLPSPRLRRPPPSRPFAYGQLRWSRLGVLVGCGLVVLLAVRIYISETARTVLPPNPATMASMTAAPAAEAADPFADVEAELRKTMSMDLLEVSAPGRLEEALLMELGWVKLDVASVRAPVTDWGGRHRDVPQAADIRIKLRFRSGELDRELGAVALVVGKYIQRYSLDISRFEVVFERPDGSSFQRQVDPDQARRLYIQRIDLHHFLESL